MEVLNDLWAAVEHHPYAVLPPLVMAEGPAATVFAGSLVGASVPSSASPLSSAAWCSPVYRPAPPETTRPALPSAS